MAHRLLSIIDQGDTFLIVKGTSQTTLQKSGLEIEITGPNSDSILLTSSVPRTLRTIPFDEVLFPNVDTIEDLYSVLNNRLNGVVPPLIRYLDTVGDGTGSVDADIDASGAPVPFFIQPAAEEIFDIYELFVYLTDQSISSGRYGFNLTPAVGLIFQYTLGGVVTIITVGTNIINTEDYDQHFEVGRRFDVGLGGGSFSAIMKFVEAKGTPLRLFGDSGDSLRVIINDNFSALGFHRFKAVGIQLR